MLGLGALETGGRFGKVEKGERTAWERRWRRGKINSWTRGGVQPKKIAFKLPAAKGILRQGRRIAGFRVATRWPLVMVGGF